jgi:hypothetical protein
MTKWEERPIEIQTLLNPAFCGEVLKECIQTYEERKGPFPFFLSFFVLPILLHTRSRDTMPYSSKYMHLWIQNHKDLLIGFPNRVKNLIPITLESITFLLQSGVIVMNQEGNLLFNDKTKLNKLKSRHSNVMDCINKAHHLGKLFASSGQLSNIFNMWGVMP